MSTWEPMLSVWWQHLGTPVTPRQALHKCSTQMVPPCPWDLPVEDAGFQPPAWWEHPGAGSLSCGAQLAGVCNEQVSLPSSSPRSGHILWGPRERDGCGLYSQPCALWLWGCVWGKLATCSIACGGKSRGSPAPGVSTPCTQSLLTEPGSPRLCSSPSPVQ